jgi:hypothetical protein
LGVEAGDDGGGDRVAIVLGEAPVRQSGETEGGERGGRPLGARDFPPRPGPDRPGGGREGLDQALGGDAGGLERRVELEPVLDPLVIGVAGEPRALRRPADAADGAGQLPLAGARGGARRRAGPGAVEGDDGRGEVDDPGDRGGDVGQPLRPGDYFGAAHRAPVEPLAPPADVDADGDHVRPAVPFAGTLIIRNSWTITSGRAP